MEDKHDLKTPEIPAGGGGKIISVPISAEMEKAYLDYAMSVIVARALPDVRDGLKPVQRRIIYAMHEQGMSPTAKFSKCAAVVGEVMKKFHPHGDLSIYDALVRMAQDFSMRYPLVTGQGNFGSIDGDSPAAMRYCVTGDTRVTTPTGTGRIDSFVPNAKPNSDNKIKTDVLGAWGNPVRASMFFHSGKHPTRRLYTREGYEIAGSYNHPLLCLDKQAGVPQLEWKLLEKIRPGDHIVIFRSPNQIMGKISERERQIALLLGAFVSEGWFGNRRAGFNNTDPVYFHEVLKAYNSIVGGSRYVYQRKIKSGSLLWELDIQNLHHLRQSPLAELEGLKSAQKRIPEFSWKANRAFKRVFLQSLFTGDGSSSLLPRKTIQISYSTRSQQLARDVQTVLLEFGVISHLCKYTNGEIKVVITNRRDARIFAQNVGFLHEKQRKLERHLGVIPEISRALSRDHVPFLADYIRHRCDSSSIDRDWLQRHNIDRIERWEHEGPLLLERIESGEVRQTIEPLISSNYYYAEVKKVEESGIQPVYSLRVDSKDHSFLTSGFISHNTESRLAPLSDELLTDIEKETVEFIPNYDTTATEPAVLPTSVPNLLLNGSSGIAVGMATNIPPHNLGELIDGLRAMIERAKIEGGTDNPKIEYDLTVEDLLQYIKGPDFPTAGQIYGQEEIAKAYATGKGSIVMRSKTEIVEEGGKNKIITTEIPYQVNKSTLLTKTADLVRKGKIKGISALRDESDRDGIRVVVELKRDARPQAILNYLYKHTDLQTTFHANMVALVDGQPRVMTLKGILEEFLKHRYQTIILRTRFLLRQAQAREHILQGLKIALDHLDEVIATIKKSKDTDDARANLVKKFGLTEIQAQAILDMPLKRLSALEREKIELELKDILEEITRLEKILSTPKNIYKEIDSEFLEIKETYGDERRTVVRKQAIGEFKEEQLVPEEDVIITLTEGGYIKRLKNETYKRQGRGGKGVVGMKTKDEDAITQLLPASTHDEILYFTNKGRVYKQRAYEVPEASRQAKGTAVVNLLDLESEEKVVVLLPVSKKKTDRPQYLFMSTDQGTVKKTKVEDFQNIRRTGIMAIRLKPGENLIWVKPTTGENNIMMITKEGQSIRFPEGQVRFMGRSARGVRGIKIGKSDEVISTEVVEDPKAHLLTVAENGLGKRTKLSEYKTQNRGGSGILTSKVTSKTGNLVSANIISETGKADLILISEKAQVIRLPVKQVPILGRATQGVYLMRLNGKDKVSAVSFLEEEEELEVEVKAK